MANAKSIPPLTSFQAVHKVTGADTGTSITDLAETSHIHLFGVSIIFLLTGAIFAFSETPVWFRVSLVVVPYLSILMDIGSWWFTKYVDPAFLPTSSSPVARAWAWRWPLRFSFLFGKCGFSRHRPIEYWLTRR
jgi:hypothetical protein